MSASGPPSPPFECADASAVQMSIWSVLAQCSPLLVTLWPEPSVLLALVFLVPLACAALSGEWLRRRARGLLRADAAGLRVGGRLVIRREDIRSGYLTTIKTGPGVRLSPRGLAGLLNADVQVAVGTEADARALLCVLQLGGAHAAARFPASVLTRRLRWCNPPPRPRI